MEDLHRLVIDAQAGDNDAFEAIIACVQDLAVGFAYSAVDYAFYSENTELANRMVIEGGRLGVGAYIRTHNYLVIGELLDQCPQASGDDTADRIDDSFLGNAA